MMEPGKGHQITLYCFEEVPKSKSHGQHGTFAKARKSKRKSDQDETQDEKKGQGIDGQANPDLLAGALQVHYSAMKKPMEPINIPSPHPMAPLLCENILSSIEEWAIQ
ncbi:hypothetical protein KC356_g4831 [Hortaea werneckii]|nr:hypothetical protein KC356_g4831 [Hortaea werneckii]